MIIAKIRGGLGNQLFQYACARKLQIQLKQKLILDASDYKYDKQRNFSLSNYNLPKNIEIEMTEKYSFKYDRRKNQVLRLFTKIFPRTTFNILAQNGVIIWENSQYVEIPLHNCNKDIYINGYWQSQKYFNNIESILKKELTPQKDIYNVNINLLQNIENSNSVCVHIRRGDYLLPQNCLNVCDKDYYTEAMHEIEKLVQNPTFFIFSDDIKLVRMTFDFSDFKNVIFIEQYNRDYEELQIMRSCHHFVMSNSSFSWWAQYLGQDCESIIIAPDRWYTDNRMVDLYMKKWKIIKTIR